MRNASAVDKREVRRKFFGFDERARRHARFLDRSFLDCSFLDSSFVGYSFLDRSFIVSRFLDDSFLDNSFCTHSFLTTFFIRKLLRLQLCGDNLNLLFAKYRLQCVAFASNQPNDQVRFREAHMDRDQVQASDDFPLA